MAPSSTATFQLNGNGVTLASLSSIDNPASAVVENGGAAAASLTISAAGNTAYAGLLRDGSGGGSLSLTKSGVGTLTLAGTGNSYTGGTTVSGGTPRQ